LSLPFKSTPPSIQIRLDQFRLRSSRKPSVRGCSLGTVAFSGPTSGWPVDRRRKIWMPRGAVRAHQLACLGRDRPFTAQAIRGGTAAPTGQPRSSIQLPSPVFDHRTLRTADRWRNVSEGASNARREIRLSRRSIQRATRLERSADEAQTVFSRPKSHRRRQSPSALRSRSARSRYCNSDARAGS
jgi:hypothetical protein